MTTLVLNPIESSTITSAAHFEPDEKWKSGLKVNIENNLRSMVNEAKQNLNDTLTQVPVSTVERERLTEEHVSPMKSTPNVAEEQCCIALERESQVKTAQSSSSQPPADISESHTSGPTPEHATWPPQEPSEDFSRLANQDHDHVPRDTDKGRASIAVGSSTSDMADRGSERPKHSPIIDKLDDMPRFARSAWEAHDRGSLWLASHSSRPVLPESWLPSTPEEDTSMSHTLTNIARRGSAASASSFWAPSVLNIPSSAESHDVTTNTKERGRDRISAMEQEWSAIYRARDRMRTASYTYTEARTSASTFERLDDPPPPPSSSSVTPSPRFAVPATRYSYSSGSLSSTVPMGYSNSSDSLSSTVPIGYSRPLSPSQPSASRPIAIKKLFSLGDDSFQSSPSPKDWEIPSHSPYKTYQELSDSPQIPDELPRSWPSSSFRTRLSSQDNYGIYHTRRVHMYDDGLDDVDWSEYDGRSIRQREESFRRREEEISLREQELQRREDVIREEEVKQKEREEKEAKRVDDEIMYKGLEIIETKEEKVERNEARDKRRAEDLRRRQEPAVRRLEEEERRMTQDVLRKSEEAKRKEDEVRLKEEASRATEEKIRRKEEELAQREGALLRREVEASRRHHQQKVQQEELRKRAEIRRQSVEEKTKQGWKFWGYNPPEPSRTTPPPRMSTSRSFSSSTGPGPIPNRNERALAASPTNNRGRSISISTSRSSTTRISLTRLSLTANSQQPSTPKTQTPSAQKMSTSRSSSSIGPRPTHNSSELHTSAANLPTDRGRTTTSRSNATWKSSTRLSSTESLRPSSTHKPQTLSAHKNTPRQMSTSRSPSSSARPRPTPTPRGNELHMSAANSHRSHSKSASTSRSNTPWASSTRLSSLASAQSSSTPKPQKLSAQKSAPPRISSSRSASSSTTGPWPFPSRNDLHTPATSSPTRYDSRSKSTSTSRSATWTYSTRPLPTASSRPSSIRKSQPLSAQQNNKVAPGAILPNTSTSLSLETTVTEEEASQELPDSASDSLEDLTNDLQGRSQYPTNFGGFGDIWKCDLVKAGETVQVAAKTIRAFESDNVELMRKNAKRVRRELKVWGRLKHDSILPLWGVANDFGPHPAMICPWADNGALTGFLERQQDVLSSQDKFSLLNDIALGLQYLHNESVVHGDLTGSNVLIYGNGRACLADFGLSTIILEFIGTSYFTSSIRGNVRWVAAELCEAPEDDEVLLSTECDIYSFGSITLQVLTCKVPYYNVKKDIAVLGQVIKGLKPEPPKESQIAPGHWEFIQQCWLPRASRPSVGDIVAFVECERQTLPS